MLLERTPASIIDDTTSAVANLNERSAHAVLRDAQPICRELRAEGDPVAVAEVLAAIEASGGRIPFSRYMDIALYGEGGYYSQAKVNFQSGLTNDSGDFNTSPEQSDDFSRCMNVGVCAIAGAMGLQPFNLIEFGAGSGRMMKDVLATMRNENAALYDLVEAHIIDYGGMNARQRRILGSNERALPGSYAAMSAPDEHAQDLAKVRWTSGSAIDLTLDTDKPTVVMTNELHDVLRADVVRSNNGVYEQKYVAALEGMLVEAWSGDLTDDVREYIERYDTVIEDGMEVAISTEAVALQRKLCKLIRRGGFICIDYGSLGPSPAPNIPWTPRTDGGRPSDIGDDIGAVYTYPGNYNPLQMPGELDLTYRPDFEVLRAVSEEEGMTTVFEGSQAELLQGLGLPDRAALSEISEAAGISDASLERLARARVLNSRFRALVATRGVAADFTTPRAMLSGYREFYE